jgi:hypothetical protein
MSEAAPKIPLHTPVVWWLLANIESFLTWPYYLVATLHDYSRDGETFPQNAENVLPVIDSGLLRFGDHGDSRKLSLPESLFMSAENPNRGCRVALRATDVQTLKTWHS